MHLARIAGKGTLAVAAYKAENDKLRAARMKENMLEGAQIEGVLRRKEAYRQGLLAHTESYINAKYRGRK